MIELPHHIPDWLRDNIPFMAMVAPHAAHKMSITRIVEAVIIAGLSGAFTISVLTIRLDERLTAFKDQQTLVIAQMQHDNVEIKRSLDKFTDQLVDHLISANQRQIAITKER